MKKYRIVPQAKDYYWVEAKRGLFTPWFCERSASSLEEAKIYVEELRQRDELKEKQLLEDRRFERDNPPIYL